MDNGDTVSGVGARPRIVISGCSGGGKSTFIEALATHGYATRPEAGRLIVQEQLAAGGDALPWANAERFIELCVDRCIEFFDCDEPADRPVVFDRSMIDNIAGYEQLGIPTPAPMARALARYRYWPHVFMAPPWPELFHPDRERRHDFPSARREYDRLLTAYRANRYEITIIPKVPVAERVAFFESCLVAGTSCGAG